MTSPLRNAARALCKAQSGVDCFDDLEPEAQESAVEHARAVILAIREPSPDALDAAAMSISLNDPLAQPYEQTAREVWQAMIDAALSERED